MPEKEYTLIKRNSDLSGFINQLGVNKTIRLAIDFECEFNLHEYGERLCLIQVWDGHKYYLIDPFHISRDLLAEFFENNKIVKYFYGADSDKSLLYKQYKIRINALFDQKWMVDVLDFDKKGLDAVLSVVLGIQTTGKKKFQRHNWTLRPINKEAIQYALSDVEYLFELNEILMKRIVEKNLTESLMHHVVKQSAINNKPSVPAILKTKFYKGLRDDDKIKYQKILEVRERYAKKINIPSGFLISKDQLEEILYNYDYVRQINFTKKLSRVDRDGIINDILGLK